jgi:hypothetical protein
MSGRIVHSEENVRKIEWIVDHLVRMFYCVDWESMCVLFCELREDVGSCIEADMVNFKCLCVVLISRLELCLPLFRCEVQCCDVLCCFVHCLLFQLFPFCFSK